MQTIDCPHCQQAIAIKKCLNCRHFTPHYMITRGNYERTNFGLCSRCTAKPKKDCDCCVSWNGE